MRAEIFLSIGIVSLLATTARTGAEVPRGAYNASDLETACELAKKESKGVALLLSDSGGKEKMIEVTAIAARSLKSHSVVVFVESKSGALMDTPPPVVTALQSIKAGAFLPRAVVTSPDLLETWSVVTGSSLTGDDIRKGLARVKGEVAEKAKDWEPSADPLKLLFKWGAKENSQFEGRFDSLEEDKIVIFDKTDRKGGIELEKLTEASLAYAKKLQALSSAAKLPSFGTEAWTSSDGRALQAKFISLEDDQITLEMAGGKSVTFPLTRLDKLSATRAENYSEQVAEALAE